MKLIDPHVALIAWCFLCFISMGFTVVALIRLLRNRQLDIWRKVVWAGLIVFVPTIGSFLYLLSYRTIQQRSNA
jgi:hypothetical protein